MSDVTSSSEDVVTDILRQEHVISVLQADRFTSKEDLEVAHNTLEDLKKKYYEITNREFASSEPIQVFWKGALDAAVCKKIFRHLDKHPISYAIPKEIKIGEVYIFHNSKLRRFYWRDDGKQYKSCAFRPFPWRDGAEARIYERKFQLKCEGLPVDYYRNEYYPSEGSRIISEEYVIVQYRGTYNQQDAVSVPHGNKGKPKTTKVRLPYSPAKRNVFISPAKGLGSLMPPPRGREFGKTAFFPTPTLAVKRIDEVIQTRPLKPREIFKKLSLDALDDDEELNSFAPRNTKQIENRAFRQKKSSFPFNNDLGDVLALSRTHPRIVPFCNLSPGTAICVTNESMLDHVADIMKITSVQFFYDTTYNVGSYYVSILTFRHPFLRNTPAMPCAFLLHEFTDARTAHRPFFEEIRLSLPRICSPKTRSILLTDREASIRDAVKKEIPEVLHLFCYSHMMQNVSRFCVGKFGKEEVRKFKKDIRTLLWSESFEAFDTLYNKFVPAPVVDTIEDGIDDIGNSILADDDAFEDDLSSEATEEVAHVIPWNPRFASYVNRYLREDLRSTCKAVAGKFPGIFSDRSGATTNVAESANAALKSKVPKKSGFFEATTALYDWMCITLVDIQRAQECKDGNFEMQDEAAWSKLKVVDPKKGRTRITEKLRAVVLKDNVSFRDDVNWSAKLKRAGYMQKDVLFKGDGQFLVCDEDKIFTVNFPIQRCNCPNRWCSHVLAVNIALNVIDNPNFSNLLRSKPSTFSEVHTNVLHHATGKKGPTRRPPFTYVVNEDFEEKFEETPIKLPAARLDNRFKRFLFILKEVPITLLDLKTLALDLDGAEISVLQAAAPDFENNSSSFSPAWLNDSIIDAYLLLLRNAEVLSVSSLIVAMLLSPESGSLYHTAAGCENPLFQDRKGQRRTWKKYEYILMPLLIGRNHWCMLIVVKRNCKILCYNPSQSNWKIDESDKEKISQFLTFGYDFPKSTTWELEPIDGPVQVDGYNCGPLCLLFAERFLKRITLDIPCDLRIYRSHIFNILAVTCDLVLQDKLGETSSDICSLCQKTEPVNSKHKDITWIACERCGLWVHKSCDGSLLETPEISKDYFCSK